MTIPDPLPRILATFKPVSSLPDFFTGGPIEVDVTERVLALSRKAICSLSDSDSDNAGLAPSSLRAKFGESLRVVVESDVDSFFMEFGLSFRSDLTAKELSLIRKIYLIGVTKTYEVWVERSSAMKITVDAGSEDEARVRALAMARDQEFPKELEATYVTQHVSLTDSPSRRAFLLAEIKALVNRSGGSVNLEGLAEYRRRVASYDRTHKVIENIESVGGELTFSVAHKDCVTSDIIESYQLPPESICTDLLTEIHLFLVGG